MGRFLLVITFLDELVDGEFTRKDRVRHDTHVTVGSRMHIANMLNFSHREALGTAPRARLTMYKVYNPIDGCPSVVKQRGSMSR
jgi:hypothetical protein